MARLELATILGSYTAASKGNTYHCALVCAYPQASLGVLVFQSTVVDPGHTHGGDGVVASSAHHKGREPSRYKLGTRPVPVFVCGNISMVKVFHSHVCVHIGGIAVIPHSG